MKKNYTYTEARLLLKRNLTDSRKSKSKKSSGYSIRAFCTEHGFKYQTVVNCLNEDGEKYPKLIKDLLSSYLGKDVDQKKVLQYTVS